MRAAKLLAVAVALTALLGGCSHASEGAKKPTAPSKKPAPPSYGSQLSYQDNKYQNSRVRRGADNTYVCSCHEIYQIDAQGAVKVLVSMPDTQLYGLRLYREDLLLFTSRDMTPRGDALFALGFWSCDLHTGALQQQPFFPQYYEIIGDVLYTAEGGQDLLRANGADTYSLPDLKPLKNGVLCPLSAVYTGLGALDLDSGIYAAAENHEVLVYEPQVTVRQDIVLSQLGGGESQHICTYTGTMYDGWLATHRGVYYQQADALWVADYQSKDPVQLCAKLPEGMRLFTYDENWLYLIDSDSYQTMARVHSQTGRIETLPFTVKDDPFASPLDTCGGYLYFTGPDDLLYRCPQSDPSAIQVEPFDG